MSKRKYASDQLRQRILDAMQRDLGIGEKMAQPFIDAVMECFAGERPYFPSRARKYPIEEIRSALEGGASSKAVVRKFDISRSKLHEIFPGGLPKPKVNKA
ncbi:hypothetical protein [Xanthomonas arboricola]|uniref:hypothetical protein n=1 Tax=Xanthomonas arboricola TaxID=56448 RepID=UPI0011B02833|nr:hypothetical protein [Xanthomonas arboricola]